jgi:hypothetical protein
MSSLIVPFAATVLIAAGALGLGHVFMRFAALHALWPPLTQHMAAFATGVGIVGWLVFILGLIGWITLPVFLVLGVLASAGIMFRARPNPALVAKNADTGWIAAWSALALFLFLLDTLRASAPPTDADSLAYHFSLPREFLEAGRVFFTPRAVDGAIPLLQHMSYTFALGMGGERAMTLWTMVTSWASAGVLFVLARRHLSREWALITALLFLTTPAVIYGSGTGQVEIRGAAFVLTAFLAAVDARRLDHVGLSVLAGVAAGFFAGSKYTGLMFIPLIGLVLVIQKRWFVHGLAFSIAALGAASPFYIWHWWNTGDPFFPVLYGLVEYWPDVPWNSDANAAFRHWTGVTEKAYPATLLWAGIYPFLATLFPSPTIESGRTGLGPVALLLLPTALTGAWIFRERLRRSPLLIAAFLCCGFYFIWFLFGASQRVRHYVPIYPLLLLCFIAATVAAAKTIPSLLGPVKAVAAGVLVFQTAISVLFTVNPSIYLLTNEPREEYLRRTVPLYDIARIANSNLAPTSRLLHNQRPLNYLLSVPYFFGHHVTDARIDYAEHANDPARLWRQLIAQGITHWLIDPDPGRDAGPAYLASRLQALGCIKEAFNGDALSFSSRMSANISSKSTSFKIYAVDIASCPLAAQ